MPNSALKWIYAGILAVIVTFSFGVSDTKAQGTEVAEAYNRGIQEMERQQWKNGLQIFNDIIKNYSSDAFNIYGPSFGLIYYHAGMCQMALGQFKEAGKNFEICYKDYPNRPASAEEYSINHYHLLSMYQWGRCEQAAEEFEGALKLYETFLGRTPDVSTYSKPEAYTNIGICYAKLGKVEEAEKYLGNVFRIFDRLKGGEKQLLYQGFLALSEQWIEKVKPLDAINFMKTYDFALRYSPYDMYKLEFDKRLLALGQSAMRTDKGLEALALRFFSYVPRRESILAELEEKKAAYLSTKAQERLQLDIDRINTDLNSGNHIDLTTFRLIAYTHEKLGNYRAAYAAYDYMASIYPNATDKDNDTLVPFHPDLLYNAERTSFAVGDMASAQYHAFTFLEKYPEHKLTEQVQSMLLEQLFRRGEYARCIEITKNMIPRMTEKTADHDLALFVQGGAYYYDGQYTEAVAPLEKHVAMYPASPYREETTYYQAGNLVKLVEWQKALALLDPWLEKYKDGELRPFALLDRGTCLFMESRLDDALKDVAAIESVHKGSSVEDSALNLKGNILQGKEKFDESIVAYSAAKSLAESQDHGAVAVESLMQLISVAVKAEKWKEAAAFYDEFSDKYSGDFREADVVANALPALINVGRTKEGLEHMENMIIRLGKLGSADLEKAVNTYGKFYIETSDGETLIARIKTLREQPNLGSQVQAWLLILLIDTTESELEGIKAEAQIKAAMADMRSRFEMKDLAPYQLGRLGDYLQKMGRGAEAAPFFEEIIARPGEEGEVFALLGLGRIYLNDKDPSNDDKGVKYMTRLKNYDRNFAEEGQIEVVRHYVNNKKWAEADAAAGEYAGNKSYNKYNPENWYLMGLARENQGGEKLADAVRAYFRCYSKYKSYVRYSAPAWRRGAEIQWNRGEKENAYKTILQMVQAMQKPVLEASNASEDIKIAKPEVEAALKLYDQWRVELGITIDELRAPKEPK
jgi:tetratricopeptide (TPR) repeat protein